MHAKTMCNASPDVRTDSNRWTQESLIFQEMDFQLRNVYRLRRLQVTLKVSYFGFPVCVHCNPGIPVIKSVHFLRWGPSIKMEIVSVRPFL